MFFFLHKNRRIQVKNIHASVLCHSSYALAPKNDSNVSAKQYRGFFNRAQTDTLPISRHFAMKFKVEFLISGLTLLDHRLVALGGDNSD